MIRGCIGSAHKKRALAYEAGYLSFCKTCVRERLRKYRRENPHVAELDRDRYRNKIGRRESILARANKSRTVEMLRAHNAVRRAIKAGKLIRPTVCEECSIESNYIEAAHWDYELKLSVKWLCRKCHRRWDSKFPKGKKLPF